MGVPGLFSWLLKRWKPRHGFKTHQKDPVFRDLPADGKFPMDYVFIDANGPLHDCCQLAFHYGAYEGVPDVYEGYEYDQRVRISFELFFDKLMKIVNMIPPTQVLFIAIDGPAPVAKQIQQRSRRMAKSEGHRPAVGFTSNFITPGTRYMFELNKFMNFRIRQEMSINPIFDAIEVIFSPPTVAGEGEHKCMDYIRSLPQTERESKTFCFVGPDGDLVMLTLATHVYRIYLLREDLMHNIKTGSWNLVNMKKIREYLPEAIGYDKGKRSQFSCGDDFIALGFFVGNDFLPNIKAFQHIGHSLESMLELYAPLAIQGKYLAENPQSPRLNFNNLFDYIYVLSQHEPQWIFDQRTFEPEEEKLRDLTLLSFIHGNNFDYQGWRKVYYQKAGVSTDEEIYRMCSCYMRVFQWIFEYYLIGIRSWEIYYPYHYPPLLQDIVKFRSRIIQDMSKKFTMGTYSEPFAQLLTVLPPRNAEVLPKPLRWLMTDPSSPLVQAGVYPEGYETDYQGKTRSHMGIPLLGFANVHFIREVYDKEKKNLRLTYERNKKGSDVSFRYDPAFISLYKSPYGTVYHNKVRKMIL